MLISSFYVLVCWAYTYLIMKDKFGSWEEALKDFNKKPSYVMEDTYVAPMWLFLLIIGSISLILVPVSLIRSLFRKLF